MASLPMKTLREKAILLPTISGHQNHTNSHLHSNQTGLPLYERSHSQPLFLVVERDGVEREERWVYTKCLAQIICSKFFQQKKETTVHVIT